MTDEKVYSKIHDKTIRNNIKDSVMWKQAHKAEELESTVGYVEYTIRFDGLIPIQVLKIKTPNEQSDKKT